MRKIKYLMVFVFGLVVIFLLPLLHIISDKLVSLTQYLIAVFTLYVLVDLVTKKSETDKKS